MGYLILGSLDSNKDPTMLGSPIFGNAPYRANI